jgi:protein TonB
MNAMPAHNDRHSAEVPANDRLKHSFAAWVWGSLIAATVVHFAIFTLWPEQRATVLSIDADDFEVITPPDVDIPDAPDPIKRPAEPVAATVDVDPEVTIAKTTLEANPPDLLPPPPGEESSELSTGAGEWTPYTVGPSILNTDEVVRAMERVYPPFLRDAGVGGTVNVRFHIDEKGVVQDFRIDQSSGHEALDEAALSIADVYRFSPALNRDQYVPVWVTFPIEFRVR